MTTSFQILASNVDIKQAGDLTPYDGRSFVDTYLYTSESSYASDPRPSRLYFTSSSTHATDDSPVQTARTRATSEALQRILTTQEDHFLALCEVWRSKFASSPFVPSIQMEKTPVTRSRVTSDALQRILARQSRQITALGEAWRHQFSSSPSNESKDVHHQRDHKLDEKIWKWMDDLPTSFDEITDEFQFSFLNLI
ncbi:hypothetical protein DFH28DRAFT_351142 [Melampsora americana]|nr:hypothetical protein DFH28DRAFT_351142 [Melampsora americana]